MSKYETTWRPIDTAPKDGSSVLLFGPMKGEIGPKSQPLIMVGEWHKSSGYLRAGEKDGEWLASTPNPYPAEIFPTHWMLLPGLPDA